MIDLVAIVLFMTMCFGVGWFGMRWALTGYRPWELRPMYPTITEQAQHAKEKGRSL